MKPKQHYQKSIKTLLIISFITGLLFFLFTTKDKSLESFGVNFLISAMYSFGYGLSNGLLNDFLDHKFSWTSQTQKRAFWAVVGAIVLNVGMTYLLNYLNFVVIQGLDSNTFFSSKWNFTNWFFINLALLISAFLHARGFMLAMKQNAKEEVVEQKQKAKSANAQFESLKNQLDPHFLFNSLNVLDALIEENPQQAQKFTQDMSKIYRYVLEQKDKELVTITEEMDFAQTYSNLLKTRFENAVQFEFTVLPNDLSGFVVPLSLQLILENCVKHNFATETQPLHIKIYSDNQFLTIENNLQTRELPNASTGVGLANIVSRYQLISEKSVAIEKTTVSFKVKLPIL